MSIFFKIKNLGLSPENSKSLNNKISLSNSIFLFLLFITVSNWIIAVIFTPYVIYSLLTLIVSLFLIPLLNNYSYNTLARYLIGINTSVFMLWMHISVLKEGEGLLIGTNMISFSLLALPWLLFDYQEIKHSIFLFLLMCCSIFAVQPLNFLVEPQTHEQVALIVSPFFQTFYSFVAVFILGGCLYILQLDTKETELINNKLIEEAENKNIEMLEKEQKLNSYISEIEKSRIEDQKRDWSNNGLAKFSDLLRNTQHDIQETYEQIISQLTQYMQMNQGALFILEEENGHNFLELKSCYAYDRKKYSEARIEIGEGLLGQCYLEKEVIYLTEVPNGYTTITSGLGSATPSVLLLVPLKINEEVFGVLEMASFYAIEEYQIEFVQKLAVSIASSISNIKINTKTKHLLQDSISQREVLQNQEEEMRQNLEELSATQEEMQRIIMDSSQKDNFVKSFLNASQDTILAVDKDLKLVIWNDTFEWVAKEFGVKAEVGMPISNYMFEEGKEAQLNVYRSILNGGDPVIIDKKYGENTVQIKYTAIKDKNLEILGVALYTRTLN
ncbi:MAG: GAF domain-containing protein [Cytophagales bacterium]